MKRALQAYANAISLADPIRLQFWNENGLTMQEVRVLFKLLNRDGQTAGELADSMNVPASSITRFCDRLAGDGLIKRQEDPEDRRCVRLYLSEEGRRIVGEIEVAGRAFARAILGRMSEDELVRLSECLENLTETAQAVTAELEG